MRIPILRGSILFVAVAALFVGCAMATGHIEPGQMPRISTGMTKQEVIQTLGPPQSASAEGNTESLYYVEERPWWLWARIQVKLVDGKVVGFGDANKAR
jgi:outer membrane protein assembly factor BamE (lipoprotein component of BamABCDE complex)